MSRRVGLPDESDVIEWADRRCFGASVGSLIAVSAVLAVASAAFHPAVAQTTDPGTTAPGVIHACYVPLTGTLYRIKETNLRQACSSSTNVEFAWTDGVGALHGTDGVKGDLEGTFVAPVVVGLRGIGVAKDAPKKGQVLSFDGDRWSPIDLPAVNPNEVNGSFVATGTLGTGGLPLEGSAGPSVTRMAWDPGKGAFRAGGVWFDGEWQDDLIGQFSVAMGRAPRASGEGSVALGFVTQALARGASALGYETVAASEGSFAAGQFTTAFGNNSTAMGSFASTNGHAGSFVYSDLSGNGGYTNVTADNQFVVRAQHMWFGTNNDVTATPDRFLETSTGAYLSSGGTWTNVSDVHRKHLFEDVSADEILDRVAALPIKKWSYKAEADSVRHLGPTAQDFYSAFHLGPSDTSIPTIDADGVSLAAIQALAKRTTALAAENAELRARLDALEAVVQQLQAESHGP